MSFARAADIIVRNRERNWERKVPAVRRTTSPQEVPTSGFSEQGSTDDRSQVSDFAPSTTVPPTKCQRHRITLSEVSTVIAEAPFKTNEALSRRHHRERLVLGIIFSIFVVFSAWHLLHRFRRLHASLHSYQEVAEEFTRKQPFNYDQLKQGNVDFETVQRELVSWNEEFASLQAQVETRFGGIFEHSSFDGELEIKPVDDDGTENEDPSDDEDQLPRSPKTITRKAYKNLGPEKKSKLLMDKTSSIYISWFLLFTVVCVAASFLIERDNDNREARIYDWVALLCIFSLIPIIYQAKLIEDSFDQALENLRWVSYMLVAQGGTPQTTYEFQLQMLCLKKLDIMATYWEGHDLTLRVSIPIVGDLRITSTFVYTLFAITLCKVLPGVLVTIWRMAETSIDIVVELCGLFFSCRTKSKTTDCKGNPLPVTDCKGNPLPVTDCEGNPLPTTNCKGNPLPTTACKGNPISAPPPCQGDNKHDDEKSAFVPPPPLKRRPSVNSSIGQQSTRNIYASSTLGGISFSRVRSSRMMA